MLRNLFISLSLLTFRISLQGQTIISPKNEVIIKGIYTDNEYIPDSLVLYIHDAPFFKSGVDLQNLHRKLTARVTKKSFFFHVKDINEPKYILLMNADPISNSVYYLMDCFIAEPGDSILMKVGEYIIKPKLLKGSGILNDTILRLIEGPRNITFEGKGNSKYRYLQYIQLERARNEIENNNRTNEEWKAINSKNDVDIIRQDSSSVFVLKSTALLKRIQTTNERLKIDLMQLERYRKSLSINAYNVLILGRAAAHKNALFDEFYSRLLAVKSYSESTAPEFRKAILEEYERYRKIYIDSLSKSIGVNESVGIQCPDYLGLLVIKSRIDAMYQLKSMTPYQVIKNNYSRKLRDYLLAYYFKNYVTRISSRDSLLSDALTFVKDSMCSSVIKLIANNSKGATAYNFALPDVNDSIVKLSDFKGKVVFMDFWYTGCGACRKYYQYILKPLEESYKNRSDIVFVTVSVDKTKYFWLKSIEAEIYTGSSTSKNVVSLYTAGNGSDHPIIKHYSISSYPRPLLISRDGKISCSDSEILRDKEKLPLELKKALCN